MRNGVTTATGSMLAWMGVLASRRGRCAASPVGSLAASVLFNPPIPAMKISVIPCAIVITSTALAVSSWAQVKIDGAWRGVGGAALAAASGNTTSTSLLLNTEMARATTADKVTLGGAINYARSGSGSSRTTTANKWGGFGQYDFNLAPKVYAFGKLGLEGDKLIDLSSRVALAAGVGYKLIDTKEANFEIFGGLGYTADKYSVAQLIGGKRDTSFSRASIYLGEASSHQISPTVSFKQRLELYPGVSGDKAVLAKFSAGLSVAMSSTMSLNVGLVDSYNSKPAAGSKSNDLGIFTGVNVKFGAL
jgi:putative salt-induced outer membrane protein